MGSLFPILLLEHFVLPMQVCQNKYTENFRERRLPLGVAAVLALLLVTHAALLAWQAVADSPMVDEPAQLIAGISHLESGRFDLFRVNPPLTRVMAAAPVLLFAPSAIDWSLYYVTPHSRQEFKLGSDWLQREGPAAQPKIIVARMACIALSLLAGLLIFLWSTKLYGARAGLLSCALWCFCPNALAYGHLLTSDMGAAAAGVAAQIAFAQWLTSSTWRNAIVAGAALALALLTKFTWLVLLLLWPVLWLVVRAATRFGWRELRVQAAMHGVTIGLSLCLVNLFYGFQGFARPLGQFEFLSNTLAGRADAAFLPVGDEAGLHPFRPTGNRFDTSLWGRVPVLLPADYLLGIDYIKHEFDKKMESYLNGEKKLGGWWYYYIECFLLKTPLPTLALWVAAVATTIRWKPHGRSAVDELLLLVTPAVVVIIVSAQTGFNHHFRYVFPAVPLLYVFTSRIAMVSGKWSIVVIIAATTSAISSLAVFPHSMSYFNELIGGPRNGHKYLVDSNLDWGQDLYYLKQWLRDHPEARLAGASIFSGYPVSALGIEAPELSDARRSYGAVFHPRPGWYAVSAHMLRMNDAVAEFLDLVPIDRCGYSIYIYHVTPQDVDRLRRERNLPPSPDG